MTNITIRAINLKQIEWAIRAADDKRGIEFIVNSFNAAIERGEMDPAFRLANDYRRYAQLVADLLNIQKQINDAWDAMHAEALEIDAELDKNEEAVRQTYIAEGGPLLSGYSLALPDGSLIESLNGSVVRFIHRASYFLKEHHANAVRETYRPDAVVIPYGWIFIDTATRAELIKQQEGRK